MNKLIVILFVCFWTAATCQEYGSTFFSLHSGKQGELPVVETVSVDEGEAWCLAYCSGNVVSEGSSAVIERGFVYSANGTPTLENGGRRVSGSGSGFFSYTITSLAATRSYHIRAYALSAVGVAYGIDMVVFTRNQATITTTPATEITAYLATLGGTINLWGNEITEKGIYWGTSESTVWDHKLTAGYEGGTFSFSFGTVPNTTYYYRAYLETDCTNPVGYIESFTTPPEDTEPPVVVHTHALTETFVDATSFKRTYAISAGSDVEGNGTYSYDKLGLVYSCIDSTPEVGEENVSTTFTAPFGFLVSGTDDAIFNTALKGANITPGELCYVRGFIQGDDGYRYGETKTIQICERPNNLISLILNYAMDQETIVFYQSLSEAEEACCTMNSGPTQRTGFRVAMGSFNVGETVYLGNTTTDCNSLADGYYIGSPSGFSPFYIVHVQDQTIESILSPTCD